MKVTAAVRPLEGGDWTPSGQWRFSNDVSALDAIESLPLPDEPSVLRTEMSGWGDRHTRQVDWLCDGSVWRGPLLLPALRVDRFNNLDVARSAVEADGQFADAWPTSTTPSSMVALAVRRGMNLGTVVLAATASWRLVHPDPPHSDDALLALLEEWARCWAGGAPLYDPMGNIGHGPPSDACRRAFAACAAEAAAGGRGAWWQILLEWVAEVLLEDHPTGERRAYRLSSWVDECVREIDSAKDVADVVRAHIPTPAVLRVLALSTNKRMRG